MKQVSTLFICMGILCIFARAQVTSGLVAYYPFDDPANLAADQSGNVADGTTFGNPLSACGVVGNAISLDGIDDFVQFPLLNPNALGTGNFSISFYFRPAVNAFGARALLSKREACNDNMAFSVRYGGTTKTVDVELSENAGKQSVFSQRLDENVCWQHVVIVRDGNEQTIYMNGIERSIKRNISRVDLANNAVFSLANTPCLGMGVQRFQGLVDELRIYNRDLTENEVESLYFSPENIINRDTLIFLGGSVDISLNLACPMEYSIQWMPNMDVSDPFVPDPTLTPIEPTKYFVNVTLSGCTARDSILVNVIDPTELDCGDVFLPNAFTPNGDGKNDEFGISNPYALEELIELEIMDRYGASMFKTMDAFERWDGTYNGEPVNPGVYIYRVRYLCNGEEKVDINNFTLIR